MIIFNTGRVLSLFSLILFCFSQNSYAENNSLEIYIEKVTGYFDQEIKRAKSNLDETEKKLASTNAMILKAKQENNTEALGVWESVYKEYYQLKELYLAQKIEFSKSVNHFVKVRKDKIKASDRGVLKIVRGVVYIQQDEISPQVPASSIGLLKGGNIIKVGPNSEAEMFVPGLGVLRIKEKTRLAFHPQNNMVDIIVGKIRNMTYITKGFPLEILHNYAVRYKSIAIAVRGTDYDVEVLNDHQLRVTVHEGEVMVSNGENRKAIIKLGSGEQKTFYLSAGQS